MHYLWDHLGSYHCLKLSININFYNALCYIISIIFINLPKQARMVICIRMSMHNKLYKIIMMMNFLYMIYLKLFLETGYHKLI